MLALALAPASGPTGSERDAHRSSNRPADSDVAEHRADTYACASADWDA
ncbi:MAG: hypothetical protein OXU21_13030 [Chloroflexota bacterium]|nr:hypothetical protein [Chloroflexota bacterium]